MNLQAKAWTHGLTLKCAPFSQGPACCWQRCPWESPAV